MSNNANARVRQSKIFEHLKVVGSESVTVLAQMFGVSEMTIRRDLDALERASLIVRQHGKALLVKTETLSVGFAERDSLCGWKLHRLLPSAVSSPGLRIHDLHKQLCRL